MRTKEEIAEYKKQWALKNKVSIKIRLQKWHRENKDKIRAYKIRNRDRILKEKRESYERCKETYKKYWKTPKARHNAKKQKYKNRATLKNLEHHKEQEWIDLLIRHNNKCVDCGSNQKIEKDHIIPLSKGGNDLIENIAPRCRTCNARKGNKILTTVVKTLA